MNNLEYRRVSYIFVILFVMQASCKTSDFLSYSRMKSGQCDFFFSPEQFEKEGVAGYAQVWDRAKMDYRIYPFTYKVWYELTPTYYTYRDWIYVGRGNEISDPHYSEPFPASFNPFKKVRQ